MDTPSGSLFVIVGMGLVGGFVGILVGSRFLHVDRSAPGVGFAFGAVMAVLLAKTLFFLFLVCLVAGLLYYIAAKHGRTILEK